MPAQTLTPQIVNTLRNVQESFMPDRCVIQKPPLLTDPTDVNPDGSGKDGVPVLIPDIPCRAAPISGTETIEGESIVVVVGYSFSMPWDTQIDVTDRILYAGEEYKVNSVSSPKSFQSSVRCLCKKIAVGASGG